MGFSFKKALKRYTPWGQAYSLATGDKNSVVAGLGVPGQAAAGLMDSADARSAAAAAKYANSLNGGTVGKALPGGMAAYYDDSWGNVLQSIQGGKSTEETLQSLLAGFKGKPGNLENFMRLAGPFIASAEAGKLRNSDAMKFLGDKGNWDLGAMAGYGSAAGQIATNAKRGADAGVNRLASMGLGRSAATSALRQKAATDASIGQGDLWSRTYQQAQQNRWGSATGLLDAHRMISQLALGQQITPRESGVKSNGLQTAVMAAGGIGQLLGGLAAL